MIPLPTLNEEKLLWNQGYKHIAGVDEVGRGCFAGPVAAAAVILPPGFDISIGVNDSKLLSAPKRLKLAKFIKEHALAFSISLIDVSVINRLGIAKASQMAFYQAVKGLKIIPDFILVDAFYIHRLNRKNQKPIIHGDRKSISIAAASIIAKVYRDEYMQEQHAKFPQYGFINNVGYGTLEHRLAIKQHGLCDIHRTSFKLEKFI